MRLARVSAYLLRPGLPIAIVVDVHHVPEATMRLVAWLTMCLMLILANAAQTGAQAPSGLQAYCVNGSADFYPYTGEPCKSGYQLGSGPRGSSPAAAACGPSKAQSLSAP